MQHYTQYVFNYYSEDFNEEEWEELQGKTNKELASIMQSVGEVSREYDDLYDWLMDNGEFQDAEDFQNLFSGLEESLSPKQLNLMKKYDFHIFAQMSLALELELK